MSSKVNLIRFFSALNTGYRHRKACVRVLNFTNCISLLKILKKVGLISYFVKKPRGFILIYLRYSLTSAHGAARYLKNSNLRLQVYGSGFLSYMQVRHLYRLNVVYVFWTKYGFLVIEDLLKLKVGGVPVCSLFS